MKKVVLLTLTSVFISSFYGQTETNLTNTEKLKFGFSAGGNYSHLIAKGSSKDLNKDISNKAGLRLGLLMDYNISDKLFISPKAELSFNNSQLHFYSIDSKNLSFSLMPVSLEFMTHIALRIGKPYIYFGPNIRIPISFQESSETTIKTVTNFGVDLGLGIEKMTKFFTFAPELRYSFGLSKIHQYMDHLYFNNISLILNFK